MSLIPQYGASGAPSIGAPGLPDLRTQIFIGGTSADWKLVQIPAGVSTAMFICIGSGGGGAGGFTRIAGTAGGGGGGGSSGVISRLIIPAIFLPPVLYVNPGNSPAAAGAGVASYVAQSASTTAAQVYLRATGGNAGTAGLIGAAGGAGGAVAADSRANCILSDKGMAVFLGGVAGSAGGAVTGAVGVSLAHLVGGLVNGGCGGAGCTTTDFAGGGFTVALPLNAIPGGAAGGGNGVSGASTLVLPWTWWGGTGGGSNNSATGGSGANGGYGSGGGGGGAGATAGGGGRGGPGVVICQFW